MYCYGAILMSCAHHDVDKVRNNHRQVTRAKTFDIVKSGVKFGF